MAVDCLSSTIQKAGPSHNKRGKKKARSAKIQSHGWLGGIDISCVCVCVSVCACVCVCVVGKSHVEVTDMTKRL